MSRHWADRAGRILAVLTLALAGHHGLAAEPVVRIAVEPATIELGESARMQVTVLVPTWQPVPPVYPSFEIPNTITRLPADSSYPTSERVGRETWSGIVRNYQVTPLIAAEFSLGGESIRITWADPGKDNQVADISVPSAPLSVRIPAGAEGLDPYLAGESLSFERIVSEVEQPLSVGDALVVQYRATLSGMPSVFLPPLAPEVQSAIATAYPEEPALSDAGAEAERLEKITLVFEHGGQLQLPGQTIVWWNTSTGQVEEARIAPLLLDVAGPPPVADAGEAHAPKPINARWLIGILLAGLAATLVIWRLAPKLAANRKRRAEAYRLSEAYAFDLLKQAPEGRAAYEAALRWLARLAPEHDLDSFAAAFGDDGLGDEVGALSRTLFESPDNAADHRNFVRGLGEARQRYLTAQQVQSAATLAPLNPTG